MESIWSETAKLKKFNSLDRSIKVDTAIIGGGLAGILTAYKLKEQGVDSIILEAGEICSGQTKNTTAKITSQHGELHNLPTGTAKEIRYKGKKAGAYRDENGRIYIVTLKCPHLKCKFRWNDSTKTWDCPCHGSRYNFKGELVDDPAQKSSILIAEESVFYRFK